jgi:2-deoxy-D-gluconate 3-dehydrogenase
LRVEGPSPHLTKCLAVEWGEYGINVNAVAPTFIRTDGTSEALADPRSSRRSPADRGLHRIGETGRRRRRGRVPRFAAASLVTGVTLLIDGGWTAR